MLMNITVRELWRLPVCGRTRSSTCSNCCGGLNSVHKLPFWATPFLASFAMPLDGHSYLVAQGWAGKGSGLREGAISRPLAIPQKRTLAGVGKDRDEAFPFWDQLRFPTHLVKSSQSNHTIHKVSFQQQPNPSNSKFTTAMKSPT